jgi:hypothetical protein
MAQLFRRRRFPQLAPTCSRGDWGRRRFHCAWKSRPYRCPQWLAVGDNGTTRCACPAAAVYTFTDRAPPECTHGGGGSVRFRTSLPSRRPAPRGSVVGRRWTVVRRPLPRRTPDAGGATSSCVTGRMLIKVACTWPIVGRCTGSGASMASIRSASWVGTSSRGMRSLSRFLTATAGS